LGGGGTSSKSGETLRGRPGVKKGMIKGIFIKIQNLLLGECAKSPFLKLIQWNIRNVLVITAECVGVLIFLGLVLYDSPLVFLIFPGILWLNICLHQRKKCESMREEFLEEYSGMLSSLASSLRAGQSLESAFREYEISSDQLCRDRSLFREGIRELNRSVSLGIPVEKAFLNFANRFPLEEVKDLSEILIFAKRLGGNYIQNISYTAEKLHDAMEVEREIESMTAEKRLELRVMAVLPAVLLLYIRLTSPDFLQAIYHNLPGIVVMTTCLLVYVFSILWGRRIVSVNV